MISALSGLDRETKDTYYLSITAQDGGTPPLTGLCAVRVFISDTNDHKPVFSPTLYLTSISEATPTGTDVIPVYAYDMDEGLNAEIDFSIVGGDPRSQFQVSFLGWVEHLYLNNYFNIFLKTMKSRLENYHEYKA